MMYRGLIATLVAVSLSCVAVAQVVLKGKVIDKTTNEPVFSASVLEKGSLNGITTDFDGKYELTVEALPATVEVSFIGYVTKTFTYTTGSENPTISLEEDKVVLGEAEIVAERLDEKQRQEALTVESMDVLAIKDAPSGNFYEGLGNLKGVDLTSASLGFKVVNTRGFNSTSPVRSLQLIDGVDNQSPGLNFSLGNFLGSSDLDVMKVDIVAGASSAFYGPGAFNGVVNMTTKDPYLFPGLSASLKGGERALGEIAVRWADYLTNEEGRPTFGYKINFYGFRANDWEATNYDPITGSDFGTDHPFGFDAVNIYGDEPIAGNNRFSQQFSDPGPFQFFRNGYREEDLVDYDTDNLKFNTGLFYRFGSDMELNYNFNYSTGSTVYQGDNRYRLENIQFFQNKIELSKKDNWFVRAYSTNEDAGDTYDIVTTAIRMQEETANTQLWNTWFTQAWQIPGGAQDQIEDDPRFDENFQQALAFEGTPAEQLAFFDQLMEEWYFEDFEQFQQYYLETIDRIDATAEAEGAPAFFRPGTQRFDSLFTDITSRKFTENGSRFFDKSALYHAQAEKQFKTEYADFRIGGNGRLYRPNSEGTIFRDTLQFTRITDAEGNVLITDSSRTVIRNSELGIYGGVEKKWMENQLIANATLRADKNQNFDWLLSPALSLVYAPSAEHTYRASFSSAIRNPTLADQYLFYDVGRATLLGNIDGQFEAGNDSLITLDSFRSYIDSPDLNTALLDYYNVDRIRPEQVRSIEVGYRGTWWKSTYVDASYYISRYKDFIGFNLGLTGSFDNVAGFPENIEVFRIAANATEVVTTQGFNIGLNYFWKQYNLSGNYSFNKLTAGEDDPIIPAFNTPTHKFNLGLSARDIVLFGKVEHVGFGVNYKWIQGFTFEGSPQFTGFIPTYDMVDFQINKRVPKINCTFKLGASNLFGVVPFFRAENESFGDKAQAAFNNENIQVYGGPRVGRLAYFSVSYDWNHKRNK